MDHWFTIKSLTPRCKQNYQQMIWLDWVQLSILYILSPVKLYLMLRRRNQMSFWRIHCSMVSMRLWPRALRWSVYRLILVFRSLFCRKVRIKLENKKEFWIVFMKPILISLVKIRSKRKICRWNRKCLVNR